MPLEELPTQPPAHSQIGRQCSGDDASAEPPAMYWTDDDVLNGKLIYMPTGRIAMLHRVEADGRKVFITPTGSLLCERTCRALSTRTDSFPQPLTRLRLRAPSRRW